MVMATRVLVNDTTALGLRCIFLMADPGERIDTSPFIDGTPHNRVLFTFHRKHPQEGAPYQFAWIIWREEDAPPLIQSHWEIDPEAEGWIEFVRSGQVDKIKKKPGRKPKPKAEFGKPWPTADQKGKAKPKGSDTPKGRGRQAPPPAPPGQQSLF